MRQIYSVLTGGSQFGEQRMSLVTSAATYGGVRLQLIPVGSPADLDFTLEGLPAGATVELAVSAVNNGGESQKTEAVSITTTV